MKKWNKINESEGATDAEISMCDDIFQALAKFRGNDELAMEFGDEGNTIDVVDEVSGIPFTITVKETPYIG